MFFKMIIIVHYHNFFTVTANKKIPLYNHTSRIIFTLKKVTNEAKHLIFFCLLKTLENILDLEYSKREEICFPS